MSHLPLNIDVKGRRIIIVGGGPVAEKRAKAFLGTGAMITVVSPEVTPTLANWAGEEDLHWLRKEYEPEVVNGAFLVVAATGVRSVDREVKEAAKEVPLVNIAGEAEYGNTHFPSYLSRGRLSIAVSTDGASPALASRIRHRLEEEFDEDYARYIDFLYLCRMKIKELRLSKRKRKEVLEEILDEKYEKEREQERMVAWLEGIT
ncbi:NAD(P)-binding protein [Salimicrobium halophilum]|uniref:precorrin-2 dehydrogenase n=1 Tax=Salimicrobium halophilum TaxID=86666 RepID=A0A1G8TWL1_9BACI|nr:NAD(P)-binding protein [Salimicrobium halophilum]SDJ45879.1 precorrin-2 dehydrogenase [Salimicrobium halophilum]